MGGQAQARVVLRLSGITKRFGPLVANDAITFDLHEGEVIRSARWWSSSHLSVGQQTS